MVAEMMVESTLLDYRLFIEQSLGKSMVLTFNSISLTLTFSNISSSTVICSILGESSCWTSTSGYCALSSFANTGHFCCSYRAPFTIRNFNKLIQEDLIVFVYHRVSLFVFEVVGALLFRPYTLLRFNNLFSSCSINDWSMACRSSCSISLLDLIKLFLMLSYMAINKIKRLVRIVYLLVKSSFVFKVLINIGGVHFINLINYLLLDF
jgi:hypothetical protein